MQPEPLAIGDSYDDLIRALRERASALGMTDKIIEEIGGFTGGHVGKLLGAGSGPRVWAGFHSA
ncbi:MAG: hypothetical protein IPK23_15015 [Rhizobiales bacterium]|nr:hypothetical protein [Hyphomicrobiales bacterium]